MKKKLAFLFPYVHNVAKALNIENKVYRAKEPIHKIVDHLYLGDFRAADNPELLKSYGITHIVNCAFNLPSKYNGMFTYLDLKLRDEPDQVIFPQVEEAYKFIVENRNTNVFVHCVHGMSRSGSVVVYYLMKEKGMRMQEGIEFIGKIREVINPNEGFRRQLMEKEKEIFGEANVGGGEGVNTGSNEVNINELTSTTGTTEVNKGNTNINTNINEQSATTTETTATDAQ